MLVLVMIRCNEMIHKLMFQFRAKLLGSKGWFTKYCTCCITTGRHYLFLRHNTSEPIDKQWLLVVTQRVQYIVNQPYCHRYYCIQYRYEVDGFDYWLSTFYYCGKPSYHMVGSWSQEITLLWSRSSVTISLVLWFWFLISNSTNGEAGCKAMFLLYVTTSSYQAQASCFWVF